MVNTKVCVLVGGMGAKEFSLLEKYAGQGCGIAIMDMDKRLGRRIKEELEKRYRIKVFFFQGDVNSEEDRDIFFAAVECMYGNTSYIICNSN